MFEEWWQKWRDWRNNAEQYPAQEEEPREMTEMETLAEDFEVWFPEADSIEDTEDIATLSDEDLEKRRVLFLRAANEWAEYDTEEAGGYAALSTAYAMEIMLRKSKSMAT